MLKSLAAWVINSYVGEYFGNINSDQLSIALHNGEVELENLPLRQDVIKHFGLPIEVSNGYIGKISLKIPVYRLKSEPWQINIDELFLVARPITDFKYNEEEEKQAAHDYKMSKLDLLESKWKSLRESEKEAQSYYASSYSAWLSYGTSFVSDIIENLQLKVNSVHIRFEDNSTIVDCPFACGIIIKNLSAHSADESGAMKYINCDTTEYLNKLVQLEGFSVYWDSNVSLFSHLELDDMVIAMRNLLDKNIDNKDNQVDHKYIVSPINGRTFLKRNCSDRPLKSEPRIVVDLQVEQCPVTLTSIQYRNMLEWSDSFNRANTQWKYRRWRPTLPVIGNVKLWWKFAIDAHLENYRLRKSRQNVQFLVKRNHDIVSYVNVYYAHLTHPETLNKEMRETKDRIESELSYNELCCLREIVFNKCDKLQSNQESRLSYWSLYNWIPRWYSSTGPTINYENLEPEFAKEHEEEVASELTFIGDVDDDSFLTRDDVYAQLNFTIQHISFTLLSLEGFNTPLTISGSYHNSKSLMGFEFSMVKLAVETSPKTSSHTLNITLDDLNILLLRADSSVKTDDNAVKMATASLNGLNLLTNISLDEIIINGSLCGLQVFDLVTDPSNNKHKRVVSIGIDVDLIISENMKIHNNQDNDENLAIDNLQMSAIVVNNRSTSTVEKALSFCIRRVVQDNILEIKSRMASLCYVHSVRLLQEFAACASDFQQCISAVSNKIKSAATEVALGIVSKGRANLNSLNKSFKKNSITDNSVSFIDDLRLDIHLETPVIVLPISSSSYNVMVAHLGQITIINHQQDNLMEASNNILMKSQILFAKIKDLSLYSLDTAKNLVNEKEVDSLTSEEFYSCQNYGIQILQETVLDICIEKKNCFDYQDHEYERETGLNSLNTTNFTLPAKKIAFPIKNQAKELALSIDIPNICFRVSYNDVLMFLQILNSLSFHDKRWKPRTISRSISNSKKSVDEPFDIFITPSCVKQLEDLGFTNEDCTKALNICQGNINDAALWLTKHAIVNERNSNKKQNARKEPIRVNGYTKFSLIEIKMQKGTLCIIDDCNETDLPLLELVSKELHLLQYDNNSCLNGFSQMTFYCNYYNRALSGWEPFIEPWQFQLLWNLEERSFQLKATEVPKKKFSLTINSKEIINMNITSTFLEIYDSVSKSWFDDFSKLQLPNGISDITFRHRNPFVPFAILNETGCNLKFRLVMQESERTISPDIKNVNLVRSGYKFSWSNLDVSWICVEPNQVCPFSFPVSTKMRHLESHLNKLHKIIVVIEGWKAIFPVSVDKVGTYFRDADPSDQCENARIVFSISLDRNARKLITIRSALLISNRLSNAVKVKFENTKETIYLNSISTVPVPLRLVRHKMHVRPCGVGVNSCESPLQWDHVRRCNEITTELQICTPISVTRNQHSSYSTSSPYRYCVLVERNNFPHDEMWGQGPGLQSYKAKPSHTITLVPPLQMLNLLPYDLRFHITGSMVVGTIKPGQQFSVHFINILESFEIQFTIENFPNCNHVTINSGSNRDHVIYLELFDTQKRLLTLNVLISITTNWPSPLTITIYAPIWIVNRTGLPLIFKQENASNDTAGQLAEHEMARSISPLLFSFTEHDASRAIVMRLGKSQGEYPRLSHSFRLEKGTWFRRVSMGHADSRKPDKMYELGIDVRNGRGRYRDTKIVTVSPRYQIENLSSYQLEFAQKFATLEDNLLIENIISSLPKSNVAFHWPRNDRDKLLCVRVGNIEHSHWSGGFAVEPNTSFQLNIRDDNCRSIFFRVEILLQDATCFIVFTDANNLPAPIRVDNFSYVQVEFFQTNTTNYWMRTSVKANSSVPYAWDESTLKPHITVRAPGGSCATYDMNSCAPGDHLTYDNFIYLAFTGTFEEEFDDDKISVIPYSTEEKNQHQLVFDVPEGSKLVFITRKERGKRSQLWRRDSSGRLIHEGSSPPSDPRESNRNVFKTDKNCLVLDISASYALPTEQTPLMLRNIDSKRAATQVWTFTSDGRLRCEFPNLFVQPRDGYKGLKVGKQIVLGPTLSGSIKYNNINIEQAIYIQKMRKGSGILHVSVCADGPTRVLRIEDSNKMLGQKSSAQRHQHNYQSHHWPRDISETNQKGILTNFEFQLIINLDNVGFSIVNKYNEELLYILLQNTIVDLSFNIHEANFNCSVQNFQVNNQLRDAEKPVVLYVSSQGKNIPLPAFSLTAQKLFVSNVEAEVYKQLQIYIKDVTFNLEEILLLKMLEFINISSYLSDDELDPINNTESHSANQAITSVLAKSLRYYFSIFKIVLENVKLSVFTTTHLAKPLQKLKKKLGIKLLRFEDASIQLLPFQKAYALETRRFLFDSIYEHYRSVIKSQASKILGTVDFLGNPIGLVNDVTDGLNELIHEQSFSGLIRNISHGISDSTAKFTSALSDSLGLVTMDQRYHERRKKIKQESSYFSAGVKGLGVGILGGVTSIVTQTYEGAVKEGVSGIFVGFGKGLVGTITKPAVGMLDFASGTASAVRENSRKISDSSVCTERIRPPRVCSIDGLLLNYQIDQAKGQEEFYKGNNIYNREDDEVFISIEPIDDNHSVLITSECLRILKTKNGKPQKVDLTVDFDSLIKCDVFSNLKNPEIEKNFYLLIISAETSYSLEVKAKHTRLRCDSESTAVKVLDQINNAKHAFEERKYTVNPI